jgi:phosphate acetyltransferase
MVRTVYVLATETGAGRSAVALGLVDVLARHVGRLAFLRTGAPDPAAPEVELARQRYGLRATAALPGLAEAHAELAADADVVVCSGGDPAADAAAAVELGAFVLLVVSGRSPGGPARDAGGVLDAVRRDVAALAARGGTLLGVVANRVAPDAVAAVRAGIADAAGAGCPTGVLPEEPLLAAPTVAEVAAALGARTLTAADGSPPAREIERVIVGAMGLPRFLDRIAAGDLVITPGDRADIVAGVLAARLAGTHPAVAGMVLTGGAVDPAVARLVAGLGEAGVPVLATDGDTYATAAAVDHVRAAIGPDADRKIATAVRLFADGVDHTALRERIAVARPARTTPLMFLQDLLERARADRRHVVLPEGDDDRVLCAAEQLLLRGVADLTVLGPPDAVRARAARLGLALDGARLVDPATSEWREEFADTYVELRRHKGVARPVALDLMADATYFGTLMVHSGRADAMVSGAAHTTAHTIRPAFEVIRTAPGVGLVSSAFLMLLADRVLVYADCAVVPDPDAEQLAEIAVSAAGTARVFGVEPRVAMLSYSTGGSGSGAEVDKVRRATALVRERHPDLPVEGPIQYDAAVDESVAATKLPGSAVAGHATVFVFPDLDAGNTTYKAVQRTARAVAVGPVLQGLAKPVNDLSRGATVDDIVTTVALTAVQAAAPAPTP